MRSVLISGILWLAFVYALNKPWQIGELSLPALGFFFSPGSGFWQNAENVHEKNRTRTITLPDVRSDVTIVFDERQVPHIFAQNELDAIYAQGYVTAMHRLWQMDISVRATAGELSAIFGPRTLAFDQRQREQGLVYAAENALKGWEKYPAGMALLEAYAAGFNAYLTSLKTRELPVEFKLMSYEPEPWSPLKTALFAKSMATRLCLAEDDLEHSTLMKWLGPERFAQLFPVRNPYEDPVIPPGTPWDFTAVSTPDDSMTVLPVTGHSPSDRLQDRPEGSNNWAVDGSKTVSGKPILCNDPHLGLSLPSVWYEIQLVTPDYNVYGVSLPGLPGVIIGFNEHIAWGITNTGIDVLDWYRIRWVDDQQTTYLLDGKEVPAELHIEKYEVKGQGVVTDTVKYTRWGPVQKSGPHQGLAMRWLAHDIPDSFEAGVFLGLNRARNYDDFVQALKGFQTPSQNFVFADKAGNIALLVAGRLPLRSGQQGRFVLDGSITQDELKDRIPVKHNPSVLNPERGFVSSANQQTTDSTYPYPYFGLFEDFRGRILNRYLNKLQRVTPRSMMQLQNNSVSLKAEEIRPHLLDAIDPADPDQQAVKQMLRLWPNDYKVDASGPVFFELWYNAFIELLWDDFIAIQDSIYLRTPLAWRTNLLITEEKHSPEFDIAATPQVETFEDLAAMSFASAYETYRSLDSAEQKWGNFRHTTIRHMANILAFSAEIPTAGHGDALNAITPSHGPSWRMIVHLTDSVEAYVVYPGGQSGNPGSPHYDDMIGSWQLGNYYTPHYCTSSDQLTDAEILILIPGQK